MFVRYLKVFLLMAFGGFLCAIAGDVSGRFILGGSPFLAMITGGVMVTGYVALARIAFNILDGKR